MSINNKKGFSLLEILVAVAIIGIITSIAVPQFTANRNEAAKVAGDTSVSNIIKAFNNCRVLKNFSDCDSLNDLKISCPDCDEATPVTNPNNKYCAYIAKGDASNPDFAACVSIEETGSGNSIQRSYGGTLLQQKICKTDCSGCTTSTNNKTTANAPVKSCTSTNDCTATACGDSGCTQAKLCEKGGSGKCDSSSNCI